MIPVNMWRLDCCRVGTGGANAWRDDGRSDRRRSFIVDWDRVGERSAMVRVKDEKMKNEMYDV